MKYVFGDIPNISSKLKKDNIVLFLDFDLTLSPLVQNPNHAFLPVTTKERLIEMAKCTPVIIISGRKLSDVKKRVNIKGMVCVGNHGMEYSLGKGSNVSINISDITKKALASVKKELILLNRKHPETIFEDKKYSVALGYRLMKPSNVPSVLAIFKRIKDEINKEGVLETRLDKKTFEVRVKTEINKGTVCLSILQNLQSKYNKKLALVYVGDSETDEDAFKILKEHGVTIRVGKSKKSKAEWYLRNQNEVIKFLNLI